MTDVHFRVAAGPEEGLGHAGRCRPLASALIASGARVTVLGEPDDLGILTRLPGVAMAESGSSPSADWLVWDDPFHSLQSALSMISTIGRLCLIDDAGPLREHADLLVGPPTSRWGPGPEGRLIRGADAVLVDEAFGTVTAKRAGPVVVAMGGTSRRLAVSVVEELDGHGIPVRLLGPAPAGARLRVEHFVGPGVAATALQRAAVVVTAHGHTPLEASVAGVPCVLGVWPHQDRSEAKAFAARLGTKSPVDLGNHLLAAQLLARRAMLLRSDPEAWTVAADSLAAYDERAAARLAMLMLEDCK